MTESVSGNGGGFNPANHLRDLRGDAYLDVRWRLVWLRGDHPDAEIETVLVTLNTLGQTDKGRPIERALFKCVIRLPSGATSTGYGSETSTDFGDFIEKAETKAIGRACAHLGYGTQFIDMDRRIVDSPVSRRPTHNPPRPQPSELPPAVHLDAADASHPITGRQLAFLKMRARSVGIEEVPVLDERAIREYGATHDKLTRRQAYEFILALEAEYKQHAANAAS
jgi:hypothetical protein